MSTCFIVLFLTDLKLVYGIIINTIYIFSVFCLLSCLTVLPSGE